VVCGGQKTVEQCNIYSIYYSSILILPDICGEGKVAGEAVVIVSDDGGREQEMLYYYSGTWVYI